MALCSTKKFIKLLFLDVSTVLKVMLAFTVSISLLAILLFVSDYILTYWLEYVCYVSLFILLAISCYGLITYAKNLCQKSVL